MSLHCKLVPVQYREYEYGLLQRTDVAFLETWKSFLHLLVYKPTHCYDHYPLPPL